VLPEIRIQNVVASFEFESKLDLRKVLEAFKEKCFFETITNRKYTFRVVAIRTKIQCYTFLVYRTGKVVCVGAKTIKDAQNSHKHLLRLFRKAGIKATLKTEAKIQNIVATTTLKKHIDLERFITQIQEENHFSVIYEPEQFPAAILRVPINQNTRATILLFNNGKLVCVGLTTAERIREVIEKLISKSVKCSFWQR